MMFLVRTALLLSLVCLGSVKAQNEATVSGDGLVVEDLSCEDAAEEGTHQCLEWAAMGEW
jgi:hypothetical protein